MSKIEIWSKYNKEDKIGIGKYGNIYKAKNIENGYYYAIKEIEKKKYNEINNSNFNEKEIVNILKQKININIKEIFNSNEYFYIVMDLCICNLEDYIKNRKDNLSINEIKEVLFQINKNIKEIQKKNYIYKSLKPKNILLTLDKIDKCSIQLSNFDIIKINKQISLNMIYKEISLSIAPEILDENIITNKSIIWNLGILIYYILFKEYPYHGKDKNELINNIKTQKIKNAENIELNDLLCKMLKININERISLNDYLNHSFFQNNDNSKGQFNFLCDFHSNNQVDFYCKNCKKNICEKCLNQHLINNHQIIHFSEIGLCNEEKNKFKNIMKKIEKNMVLFNKMKNDIQLLIDKMKLIKENNTIFENDQKNNFKKYYIDFLSSMKEKIKIEKNLIIIDLTSKKKENLNIFINNINKQKENNDNNNKINDNIFNNIHNERDNNINNNETNENIKNKDVINEISLKNKENIDRIILPNPLPEIDLTNINYKTSDFTNNELNDPNFLYSINSFFLIKYELQCIDDKILNLNGNIPQDIKDKRNNLICRQVILKNYINEEENNTKKDYCKNILKILEKYKKLLKYFIDKKESKKSQILKEEIYILNLELNQLDKNLIESLKKTIKEEEEEEKEIKEEEENADLIFNIPKVLPEIDLRKINYKLSDFSEEEMLDPHCLSLIITLNSILYEIQFIDDNLKKIEGRTPKEIRQKKNRLCVQSEILKNKIEEGKISVKQYKQICKNILEKHLKLLKYYINKKEKDKSEVIQKRIYLIKNEIDQLE